jgi:hypothetical protein
MLQQDIVISLAVGFPENPVAANLPVQFFEPYPHGTE